MYTYPIRYVLGWECVAFGTYLSLIHKCIWFVCTKYAVGSIKMISLDHRLLYSHFVHMPWHKSTAQSYNITYMPYNKWCTCARVIFFLHFISFFLLLLFIHIDPSHRSSPSSLYHFSLSRFGNIAMESVWLLVNFLHLRYVRSVFLWIVRYFVL